MTADKKPKPEWFDTFEESFSDGVASCRATCKCGREFYNPDEGAWSWNDGELEALEANENATGLDYAPGYLTIEGVTYVNACDCWHTRAITIGAWILANRSDVAKFLNAEKDRLERKAGTMEAVTT